MLQSAHLGHRSHWRKSCPVISRFPSSAKGSLFTNPVCKQGTGIVIVDHGSRKNASNAMLVEFKGLFRQFTSWEIVEIAHMELARPSIEEAITKCVEQGASTVVVAPYFLSNGRHIQEDIPALVQEAKKNFPSLTCIIADPIGVDSLMVKLIQNRIEAALTSQQSE